MFIFIILLGQSNSYSYRLSITDENKRKKRVLFTIKNSQVENWHGYNISIIVSRSVKSLSFPENAII